MVGEEMVKKENSYNIKIGCSCQSKAAVKLFFMTRNIQCREMMEEVQR